MEQVNDESLVKITDICRACLTRTENMKYLMENSDDIFLLLSKFASVANLEIELGFKYPSYLCTVCEEKILNSYEFQLQCQKSNELVNEYLTVFEKQDTGGVEPGYISKNLNTSEEINVVQVLQDTTETLNLQNDEICMPIVTSTCETNGHNEGEYDEQYQENLSKVISDLKEKYSHDNVCVFCEFQTANSTALSVHISRMHKESKDSWCSTCNKVFSSLEAHMDVHKNDFMCKFCTLQCSTFKSIIEHLHSHQVPDRNFHVETEVEVAPQENISICQVCKEKFDNVELLEIHSKTHSVSCNSFKKTFAIDKLLLDHKCSRGKRKKSHDSESNICDEDHLLGKDKSVDTTKSPEKFRNFNPKEVPPRNRTFQRMRLTQYSVEDVERAISIVREKFYRHVTCIFCNFTAITNRSLSVHVTRVHRECKGKWCSSCNRVIEDQTSHNIEVHFEDLKCPFCRKIKTNMGHFMEHLASHSAERLHKCDICHKSFISPRHLRLHRETHVKDRPFKCEICKKIFLQTKHLNSHLKAHQRSNKNGNISKSESTEDNIVKDDSCDNYENDNLSYKSDCAEETVEVPAKPHNYCKECNKKVRSLPSHYSKHHNKTKSVNNEKQNLCPHCGKRFKTRSKLTVHIRTHTGETPYKCQYCDKRVKTRNILVVHERTHTGEKPYMCTVCGKSFAQSSMLNTHARIHTGRPEQCTICEKRFCRPAELRLHMRKHTGEKPYICDQCGQGFKQKSHLVEHTKTHNDDRPYKCEYCEKAFKSSGTLKSHLQIHTGQKPFKCSKCSYACRQPYSLTQHMVQHENDQPPLDDPHKSQLCQRNYATLAHLRAHHKGFHSDLKVKSLENFELAQTNNELVIDREDQNNIQISQISENQMADSGQVQTESVENIDTMIIHTEIDDGEIKFEPIQIQFTTLQDL